MPSSACAVDNAHTRRWSLPPALIAVATLFLLVVGYLVWTSLVPREAPVFAPSPIAGRPLPAGTTVVDTLTIDARAERQWQFVDFDRRSVVIPPDTPGWDIAVRRFHFMSAGGLFDLGPVPFDSVMTVPDTGYVADRLASDTLNPAIARWYEYSVLTHLLTPNGHTYAVRTRDGRHATLALISYYCPEMEAGCVTLQYRYPMPAVSGER